MTNFEYFRESCKPKSSKQVQTFTCHILYKDNRLEFINNDIERLYAIDAAEILYFEGIWRYATNNVAQRNFVILSTWPDNQHSEYIKKNPTDFNILHITMLRELAKLKINKKVIDSVQRKLYHQYKLEAQSAGFMSYIYFMKRWCSCIRKWRKESNEETS